MTFPTDLFQGRTGTPITSGHSEPPRLQTPTDPLEFDIAVQLESGAPFNDEIYSGVSNPSAPVKKKPITALDLIKLCLKLNI